MVPQRGLLKPKPPTGAELVDQCADMADALLKGEFNGPSDSIADAWRRIESKFGIPTSVLFSLRYRKQTLSDIRGSVMLRIASALEQMQATQEAKLRASIQRTETIIGANAANSSLVVRKARALVETLDTASGEISEGGK